MLDDYGNGNSQPYGCRGEVHEDARFDAARTVCKSPGSSGLVDTINYCSDSSSHTYSGYMEFRCK